MFQCRSKIITNRQSGNATCNTKIDLTKELLDQWKPMQSWAHVAHVFVLYVLRHLVFNVNVLKHLQCLIWSNLVTLHYYIYITGTFIHVLHSLKLSVITWIHIKIMELILQNVFTSMLLWSAYEHKLECFAAVYWIPAQPLSMQCVPTTNLVKNQELTVADILLLFIWSNSFKWIRILANKWNYFSWPKAIYWPL